MALTSSQIEHYRHHGWVAPVDVMPEDEAAALLAAFEAAEAAHPGDLHAEHRNNAHLVLKFLADVVIDPRIVESVAALVGSDLALWSTVLFVKEPASSAFVSWHQDAHYMGLEPEDFVTAWLALTPSTRQSGCVSVIPGSHRRRFAHTDRFGDDNILTRGQEVDEIDPATTVHLELRPGQMSLHHPRLVHGSQPNRSDHRRVGLALQSYLGAGVRPVRGEHHVVAVCGAPPAEGFTTVPLPSESVTEDARRVRAAANAALSSVLYDGAEVTRRL